MFIRNTLSLTASIVMILMLASTVSSEAPKLISYQGKATDASGNPVPDGNYPAQFNLYHYPATGISTWQEVASVTTKDGLFAHTLGTVTPIIESQFHSFEELYLQVTFNGEVLMPRTRFGSVPYAFHVNSIDGSGGGIINGYIEIYNDVAGNEIAGLYGDANGDAVLYMQGQESGIQINTGASGSAAVVFPEGAIQTSEILDEPGIAYNVVEHSPPLGLSYSFSDLVTTSITTPTAGYIVLIVKASYDLPGGGGWWTMQISESHSNQTNISNTQSFDDNFYNHGYCQRVFYKGNSGTYTFLVEAEITVASGTVNVTSSSLLAMFIPTSYGAVSEFVTGQDIGQFDKAVAVNSASGEQMYKVDLRDLELRAAKAEAEAERARADAEKAQRELLRAKYESSIDTEK